AMSTIKFRNARTVADLAWPREAVGPGENVGRPAQGALLDPSRAPIRRDSKSRLLASTALLYAFPGIQRMLKGQRRPVAASLESPTYNPAAPNGRNPSAEAVPGDTDSV